MMDTGLPLDVTDPGASLLKADLARSMDITSNARCVWREGHVDRGHK
jgi:hypothetical protein